MILYMLVSGRAPFQEANDSETLTMILDCKYYVPAFLSIECRDLIERMLVRNPTKRMTMDEIVRHSWLTNGNASITTDPVSSTFSLESATGDEKSGSEHKVTPPPPPPPPLVMVRREHLSADDHARIIDSMVNGKIATQQEILR